MHYRIIPNNLALKSNMENNMGKDMESNVENNSTENNMGNNDDMGNMRMIVVAGNSGVYVGYAENGVHALGADKRVVLRRARHLRRYYVYGCQGDGAASDLASIGIDPSSQSIGHVCEEVVLVEVLRAFSVSEEAKKTFDAAFPL